MPHISLRQVSKAFGTMEVIPPLDLDVEQGEFLVLVGPSGCGKTTTLRMVAGLDNVSGGAICIAGRDVTGLRPGLRNCAMVFQNYALYPHMTVRENIAYGMKVRREDPAEIERRLEVATSLLGLKGLLERKPRQLSGGQRQRVAIGRAIVRQPEVFLFDEPLSNLDAKLRVEMRTEIKQLQRRLGTTAVYVTHDQIEAMTMADRVVLMNAGRIEQVAPPITLYERPANLFVAAFVGTPSMNFFQGILRRDENGLSADLGPVGRFALGAGEGGMDGRPIVFGIRPEHLGGANAEKIEIIPIAIEPLGPHTIVVGTVADTKVTAQINAHLPVRVGEAIPIGVDLGKVHIFDASTGARIDRR